MKSDQLMTEMIDRCAQMIREADKPGIDQPKPLRQAHLLGMCRRMIEHSSLWAPVKLHRWLGFIQCAMIANGIIDLDGAKQMFAGAKNAFGEHSDDLLDHLDLNNPFEFDIGGQG